MEVLRHLRPLGRVALALATLTLLAAPADAQRRGRAVVPPPPTQQWPVKTRAHVDLWLHGFALLQEDTTLVPLFARGYAERMTVLKNSRGLYTQFDAAREELSRTGAARNLLLDAQFLPLYFGTWEEMQQAFEYFFKAEGNPRASTNREVQGIIAFLGQYFRRPEDRAWAQRFMTVLADEHQQFHKDWWIAEFRARSEALAAADSLWQETWRPGIQRFLNYTGQASGDLVLSFVLGGEGRALPAGKNTNQYAVAFPGTADSAEVLLFSFAHEAAGVIAKVAVDDNLTPAQQRSGLGAQYGSAGLVRGGALIVEQIQAGMGQRYARWYLAQTGRDVPLASALATLAEVFPMPEEMLSSMQRQIALSFTGI
jgi:hypothetical protein